MKYLYAAMLLMIIYTTASCKKDKPPPPPPSEDSVYRISMVKVKTYDLTDNSLITNDYSARYSYDSQGLLAKIVHRRADSTLMAFYVYERKNGLVIGLHTYNSDSTKAETNVYEYVDKRIKTVSTKDYHRSPSYTWPLFFITRIMEYTQGLLTKVTYPGDSNASSSSTLTWSQGNIIQINRLRKLPTITFKQETILEYDNKLNPYFNIGGIPDDNEVYNSRNNITSIKWPVTPGAPVKPRITTYEYNAKGYPTASFTSYPDGKKISEHTFEYAFFPVQ
ncbi:hypothetical protein [Chitinophaga defluvii]|uniref:YD repeat-containing protein n=1 Tax=Chitinophaga defluvii TaxID=3163343 RepID=A0ABV2T8B7_9BACT